MSNFAADIGARFARIGQAGIITTLAVADDENTSHTFDAATIAVFLFQVSGEATTFFDPTGDVADATDAIPLPQGMWSPGYDVDASGGLTWNFRAEAASGGSSVIIWEVTRA